MTITAIPSRRTAGCDPRVSQADNSSSSADWWNLALAKFPTGVAVVAARDEQGRAEGMVVSSFVPISQEPPLMGMFPAHSSSSYPFIDAVGRFSLSLFSEDGERTLDAVLRKEAGRFDSDDFVPSGNGAPRLANAVAWFDGRVVDRRTYGDHDLVVATIDAFGSDDSLRPLLYRHGGYGAFVPLRRLEVAQKERKAS